VIIRRHITLYEIWSHIGIAVNYASNILNAMLNMLKKLFRRLAPKTTIRIIVGVVERVLSKKMLSERLDIFTERILLESIITNQTMEAVKHLKESHYLASILLNIIAMAYPVHVMAFV
jgi:hypothetical protein